MKADTIPTRADDVDIAEIEGELVLYRLGAHQAIHLNETATVIFNLCDGSRSIQEIIDLLTPEFPIAQADIAADVLEAVQSLVRKGVLQATSYDR
jgi:coenzyme PQQ biosynthesis protein PqqD